MSVEVEEVDTHDTHRILNFIGKDVFLSDSISNKKSKLDAYEKCISEIRDRVLLEDEVELQSNFWRGVK